MLEVRWLALGFVGFGAMFLWAVAQPEERVYLTAGISFMTFGAMAYTAPQVERLTETGAVVEAPISLAVQMFVGLLAILSLAVLFLYRFDEYPPEEIEPP